MIHGHIQQPDSWGFLRDHPAWAECFDWLEQIPVDIPLGVHELRGRALYAWVQEYQTVPAHEARFESHRAYIDLQYTLAGAECIDWHPVRELVQDGPIADDVQFWLPPEGVVTSLLQSPGRFAIFLPGDAHRPKVTAPGEPRVRKLVIKASMALFPESNFNPGIS